MNALEARPEVEMVRVDGQHNAALSAALATFGHLRGYGTWKYSKPGRALTDARVRRRLGRLDVDAVLGVADVETIADVPTFLFQDGNFSTVRAHRDVLAEHAPLLVEFPQGRLDELVAEQRATYAAAAGVLTFSQWFADWLVDNDGLDRDRVHVVGGGLDVLPAQRDPQVRGLGGRRVLFIGREFSRKGGELVVSAVERLRASGAGDFTLTIVGPASWPLSTPVPDWVDFRAEVPADEVRRLWAEHDIFALPTWYEPYGKVFLEARAAGVPVLGRNAFCMPELVPPSAGVLIPPEGRVDAVADGLLAISDDHDLFARTFADSDRVRGEGTWAHVAERAINRIRQSVTS
jgi:glycosyltransferase involved in cell wall biosynthesis